MKGWTLSRAGEGAILLLAALSILWKGGKTLEMTWLFAGLAAVLSLLALFGRVFRVGSADDRKTGDPHLAVWGLLLFFALWTILGYVFSETRNYGLDEVFRDTAGVLIFLWAVRLVHERKNDSFQWNLATVLTLSVFGACLMGLLVYVFEPVDRFVGSFFDHRFDTDFWPNAWGQFLLLSWPLVLYRGVVLKGRRQAYAVTALLGLMTGCLFLSYSRGSILSLGLQCAVLVACTLVLIVRDIRYRKQLPLRIRTAVFHGSAVLCVGAIIFLGANALRATNFPVQSVSEKVTFTASEGRSSIDERAQFWNQSLRASLERPVFGYGPYSFRFVQTKSAEGVLATSDHPHNVFLKYAMERGWPAALAFAALLLSVGVYSLWKLFFNRRADWSWKNDVRDVLFGIAIVGVIAHSLIDYNLQFVGIALPFWLVLASVYSPASVACAERKDSFRCWKFTRVAAKVEFLLALSLLVLASVEGYYLVTSSFGRHAEAKGNRAEALEWYGRSEGELFSRDLLLSKAVLLMDDGRMQESSDTLDAYAALNPHDARVWKLKGILALKDGDPRTAFGYVSTAFDLGKMTDAGIVTLYLQSALDAGMRDEIESRRSDLNTLFYLYADAVGQNAHFIALSRNVEELQTIARLLGRFFPDDASEYLDVARKAAEHAATERERFDARAPGMLW